VSKTSREPTVEATRPRRAAKWYARRVPVWCERHRELFKARRSIGGLQANWPWSWAWNW